jgi:hypothetical protein
MIVKQTTQARTNTPSTQTSYFFLKKELDETFRTSSKVLRDSPDKTRQSSETSDPIIIKDLDGNPEDESFRTSSKVLQVTDLTKRKMTFPSETSDPRTSGPIIMKNLDGKTPTLSPKTAERMGWCAVG